MSEQDRPESDLDSIEAKLNALAPIVLDDGTKGVVTRAVLIRQVLTEDDQQVTVTWATDGMSSAEVYGLCTFEADRRMMLARDVEPWE